MAAKANLTAKRVTRCLKKPGRYRDAQVLGLLLVVVASAAKKRKAQTTASWQLRYERNGKERWLGLGPAPLVTLQAARERAQKARLQLLDGIDPIDARKAKKAADALAAAKAITFEAAVRQYYDQHKSKWKNIKHAKQFLSTLEDYAFPKIGRLAVADVDTGQVLRVLEQDYATGQDPITKKAQVVRLWDGIPETANRLRGRIETVLDWATVRGFRVGDNPARWRGHLSEALPGRRNKGNHHPALDYADLPAFMHQLRSKRGVAAKALEFTILTAGRTGAVVGATWDEIDLTNKVWTVPPTRAGTKITGGEPKPRRVPLSEPAVELLRGLPREKNNSHVFIGGKEGEGLSNMAMLELLRGMVPDKTVHGFRSTFKDWASETTNYPNEVSEAALWHVVADKVEAAYRRGELFEKRRRLMRDWARFASSKPAKKSDTVVPLRKVATR